MKNNREVSVDVLRGFAILFMIIGHSIFFRFGLTSWPLNTLLNFANSFCYITFLFAFGYGSYFFIIKPTLDEQRSKRISKRIISLILMYYIAALVSIMSSYSMQLWNVTLFIHELKRVVLLEYFPGFTEYLPSFAILTTLLYILKNTKIHLENYLESRRATAMILVATAVSVLTNVVVVMNKIAPPSILRLFIGSVSGYDFPVLQYLPIFLIGIVFAKQISTKEVVGKLKLSMFAYLTLLGSLILSYSFNITNAYHIQIEMINTMLRWPPSLLFLTAGISKTMLFFLISFYIAELKIMKWLGLFMSYMGNRSMGFLIYHLLVLFVMKILQIPLFNLWELMLFLILLPMTYLIGETIITKKINLHSTI